MANENMEQDMKLGVEELDNVSGGGHVPGVDYNPFDYDALVYNVMWGLAVTSGRDTTLEMLIEASKETLLNYCNGTYPDSRMPKYIEIHAREHYAPMMNKFANVLGWRPWTPLT